MNVLYFIVVATIGRVDLSGGWTDTPPICYEAGGFVISIALKLDGEVFLVGSS